MNNIYLHIPEFKPGSIPLVLATVISTQGSTPQKAGSSALFSSRGLICGTVGGGVLEGRVQKIAIEAASTGESNIHFPASLFNLRFHTADAAAALISSQNF